MTQKNRARVAIDKATKTVEDYLASFRAPSTAQIEVRTALAELEVRAEQARQLELANMIAMLANPESCPVPRADVVDRIEELFAGR